MLYSAIQEAVSGPGIQTPSMGLGAEGRYELRFTPARKGLMPGECLVRVSVLPEMSAEGIPTVSEALKAVRIPEHYGRQSTLIRTVKPGRNQIDIEIDTASAPTKPK